MRHLFNLILTVFAVIGLLAGSGVTLAAEAQPCRHLAGNPIVLVEDDGGGHDSGIWSRNLDSLGIRYDRWNIRDMGSPTVDDLVSYRLVIWSCGDENSNSLNRDNQRMLERYYDRGNSIILSGSRVAGNLGWGNRFFRNVFGIEYVEWRTDIRRLAGRDAMSGKEFEPWGAVEVVKLDSFGAFADSRIIFGLEFSPGTHIPYPVEELRNYGAGSISGRFGRTAMFLSFSLDSVWSSVTQRRIVGKALWEAGRSLKQQRVALSSIEDNDGVLDMDHARLVADQIINDLRAGRRCAYDRFARAVRASARPGTYAPVAQELRDFVVYALVSGDDELKDLEPLMNEISNDLDDLEPLMCQDDLSDLEPLYMSMLKSRSVDDDLSDIPPLMDDDDLSDLPPLITDDMDND